MLWSELQEKFWVLESTRNDLLNVEEQIPLKELSSVDDIEEQETFADEKEFQRKLDNQYKALDNLTGNTQEEHKDLGKNDAEEIL